jgi:predicted phage terminase large subunit-like protein
MNALASIDSFSLDQIEAELLRLDCEESLLKFVEHMWPVLEPATEFVLGRPLDAICEHLEAVSDGRITRLLINVPPGSMKSLLVDVFWPAWEWTTKPHLRYVSFSYNARLTEQNNGKFRDLVLSEEYQKLWGPNAKRKEARFTMEKVGEQTVSNSRKGRKIATGVGGTGTGLRGDRVIFDDPHNVADQESAPIREKTTEWFITGMSNRINDQRKSAIVIVMQRVHEEDVSGVAISESLGYCHLMIPAEFEEDRAFENDIGWIDWRTYEGEPFWPERFPPEKFAVAKRRAYAWAGQYQQRPEPKGGGILKRDHWQAWTSSMMPAFSFIVAAVDTAHTEDRENDPSALTIWGVWEHKGQPSVMLISAWHDHVTINRLVKVTAAYCRNFKVHRLLIESKSNGHALEQELRRMYLGEDKTWGVTMMDPKKQDKVARVHSVTHLFEDGLIWAPFDKESGMPLAFADKVIEECAKFPRGSHDDLVDTSVYALRYLRDTGMLIRPPEVKEREAERTRYRRDPEPLYDV